MKKTYITPALLAVKIESAQMLANSPVPGKPVDTTVENYSNKYQGGFLWDDDNTEAK